jgi:hypothetical protein
MLTTRQTALMAAIPSILILGVVAGLTLASEVTLPSTFTPGTVADANEVNQNFDAVKTAVDDNDARITELEGLPPHVLAAVHVSGSPVAVTRWMSNLPGSPVVTVDYPGVGEVRVDFGADVSGRFYSAVLGHSGVSGHPALIPGQISVSPRVGNNQVLEVKMTDSPGNPVTQSFYVVIY